MLKSQTNAFIDANFERETAFLAELVKVPSDNPPGDCAPIAERAKALLEGLGLTVEAHIVPPGVVDAFGMKSVTNLIVRKNFGDGPVIALNAHGDVVPPGMGWSQDPYGAKIVETQPLIKGGTASASYKPAVLENGVTIQVPPFISEGEVVVVDPIDGRYIERAK